MADKRTTIICAHFVGVATILTIFCNVFPKVFYYYSWTAYLMLYVCLALCTYRFSKFSFLDERIRPDNKAVLITGCDTGFGNQLARRLDTIGFHVFASCLFPDGDGAAELKQSCSDRLQIVQLDVTKDESVEKASIFVKDNLGSDVLWAVVNNAGVLKGINTDFTTMEDYKFSMEVNALGMVRVTKAFLPLLKKSKGRVVNITSLVGRFTLMGMSAYIMSKFAAVGFTEALSHEMVEWGVKVISIEPEFFRTDMVCEKHGIRLIDEAFHEASEDMVASYGEDYREKLKKPARFLTNITSSDIHCVIDDMEAAVTHSYPDCVYAVRRNLFFRIFFAVLSNLPYGLYQKILLMSATVVGNPVPKDAKNTIFDK